MARDTSKRETAVGSKPSGNCKFGDSLDGHNMPRDNSGGPPGDGNDYDCSTCFGDGGKIVGEKPYLTQRGGVPD